MASKAALAMKSVTRYAGLAAHGSLRLRRDRLGQLYKTEGGNYQIFRDTNCTIAAGETVILVIGFRLKLIGSSRLLHWLFQRVCILTTPFWSGLSGFRTKLWMVEPRTKNYMGVYDWRGKIEAQNYINYLLPILRFFSVKGSVWVQQIYSKSFEEFLRAHAIGH